MGHLADFNSLFVGRRLANFVETGCYQGAGLKTAMGHFQNYFSCDISAMYVSTCKNKYPNASIEYADSIAFLKFICPLLTGKSFFWLDAHYPRQYDATIPDSECTKFPVLEELKIIKREKFNYRHDIILCDDMRVVQTEDNPVRGAVGDNNLKPYHFAGAHTFSEYIDLLSGTHTHTILGVDTLAFIPRG